jgi:hypothetical protein
MKVKLTQEQANQLAQAKRFFSNEELIKLKIAKFDNYTALNDLSLEDFVIALFQGYEIERPATPKLKTNKIDISFNNYFDRLVEEKAIFIGIKNVNTTGWKSISTFSIKEAEYIGATLLDLVRYYRKYSQND